MAMVQGARTPAKFQFQSPSPPPPGLAQSSPEGLTSIRLRNNNVRQQIYKEVKRPDRGLTELWDSLTGLQFIHEVRQEAVRFKRVRLAEQLLEYRNS